MMREDMRMKASSGRSMIVGCLRLIWRPVATVPNHIQNLDEVYGYARDGRRIKRRRKSLFSGLFGHLNLQGAPDG